jgi:hypothetical protein
MHRLSLVRELLSFPTAIKTAEKFGVRLNDIRYFYLSSVFTILLPDATFFLLGIHNLVFRSFQLFHPRSFPLSSAVFLEEHLSRLKVCGPAGCKAVKRASYKKLRLDRRRLGCSGCLCSSE